MAQIAVRLNHVHPDGAVTRITYGVMNLTHHLGHDRVTPLDPDQKNDVTVISPMECGCGLVSKSNCPVPAWAKAKANRYSTPTPAGDDLWE